MHRRQFLAAAGSASLVAGAGSLFAAEPHRHVAAPLAGPRIIACDSTYASPKAAMEAPPESLAFVPCIYAGTDTKKPDYLAVVNVDDESKEYGKVISRLAMPNVGDELHHFGWNACSSCHGNGDLHRQYLVLPGVASGRIHIVDVADPMQPKMHKVIEGAEIAKKTNLSTPHTVHCLENGQIMLSMLGDAKGEGPGGFLLLDQKFEIVGRWEKSTEGMKFNYDFWYQPRHNVMISSEWGAPNTVKPGFKLDDVKAGKYGQRLHFWDWTDRKIAQSIDLGAEGLIPLEVRFHHNPASTQGFVGAALSSAIFHWQQKEKKWTANKVVQVEPVETAGWPFPVPGLITDIVLSLDDRWLYFSNWLHGDIRQYDMQDPTKPKLTGQLWLGGVIGKGRELNGKKLPGGPQMLQLSLDGKRLYVTSSLYSSWDDQFYPSMKKEGSYLLQVDCDTTKGGLTLNEKFHVDFGKEPGGPARAHEIRFPGGDCTSDIWV